MKTTLLVIALLTSIGLAPRAEARLRVVATTQDLAWLAQAVGGDAVEVTALSRGYQDPHFIDARPNLLVDLNRAGLLLRVGLELEVGWLPRLVGAARNPRIQPGGEGDLDASTAIAPLDVRATADRAEGDIHPRGNPHYWVDPDNGRRIARAIAARIARLEPGSKAKVDARLEAFDRELVRRIAGWKAQLAPVAGRPIVTQHKSWSYFSRFAGLEEVGYVEPKPGVPPSPSHLAQLVGLMRQRAVKAVLVEVFYSRRNAETVARQAGARLVVLPNSVGGRPEIKSYFDLMDAIVREVATALR